MRKKQELLSNKFL